MSFQQSPQDFARSLKSAADPPEIGGPTKIEIATTVWHDSNFDFPGKRETIVEWILTRLLKGGQQTSLPHPLVDARYWELLWNIISSCTTYGQHPLKSWLAPLIYSVPIAPVLQNYFSLLADFPVYDPHLTLVSCKSLAAIWPLSATKLTADALLECFGVFLPIAGRFKDDGHLTRFGLVLASSLHAALGNAANGRKLCGSFIQKYLKEWVQYLANACDNSPPQVTLGQAAYSVGIDILFNFETVKYHYDQKSEHLLFATLRNLASISPAVVDIIPRLFGSFVHYIKKQRSSLFAQGSNRAPTTRDEARAAMVDFYLSCRSTLEQFRIDEKHLSARVALTRQLDQENLYLAGHTHAETVLKKEAEFCVSLLNQSDTPEAIQSLALEYLTVLARIHYNIVESWIPLFLPHLLELSSPSAFTLLQSLLDYHAKTRSMGAHIQNVIDSLSPQSSLKWSGDVQRAYQISSSGAILHPTYLEKLGKSIHSFLTPLQIPAIIRLLDESLNKAWGNFHRHYQEDDTQMEVDHRYKEMEINAAVFAHTAKLASVVLSSLQLRAVPDDTKEVVQPLLWQIQTAMNEILWRIFKISQLLDSPSPWSSQIVVAATMRLQYALLIAFPEELGQSLKDDFVDQALEGLKYRQLLPELRLEMLRFLMYVVEDDYVTKRQVLDISLQSIIDNIAAPGIAWSGLTYRLTSAEPGSSNDVDVAFLHLLVQRWLPTIDTPAYESQLEKLVRCLLSIPAQYSNESSGLGAQDILLQALFGAQFWELGTLRNILLAEVLQQTKLMDGSTSATLDQHGESAIRRVTAAYDLLLMFPPEYIPRNARLELTKRAYATEAVCHECSFSMASMTQSLVTLRTFAYRMISTPGSIELTSEIIHAIVAFVERLLNQEPLESGSDISDIGVKLIEAQFGLIVKSPNGSIALIQILEIIRKSAATTQNPVQWSFFIRFVDVLVRDSQLSQFSVDVQKSIWALLEETRVMLRPQMAMIGNDIAHAEIAWSWHRLLILERWLGAIHQSTGVGPPLATDLLCHASAHPSKPLEDLSSACVAILLEEIHVASDRLRQLELTLATYVALFHNHKNIERPDSSVLVDSLFSRSMKSSSAEEYTHVLTHAAEFIGSTDCLNSQRQCVLRLASVLLHDPPQGALKAIQMFTSKTLATFADDSIPVNLPQYLSSVLEFLSQCCTERPAALRLSDVANIWTVLTHTLTSSHHHELSTCTQTFHSIITVTSALIRLRRDLVVHTLPQLGIILQSLLLCLRGFRENLGPAQKQLMANTLPAWINPEQPLGAKEAKALARLFEGLTSKTVPRNHVLAPELQKAESLAKPFSKHVSYVIKVYVDAMNEPFSILSSSIRRELRAGLYALCSILSNHCRDALMVSALDAGGKTTMKILWKEYEKHRYTGKG